jgi:hypothetical protein
MGNDETQWMDMWTASSLPFGHPNPTTHRPKVDPKISVQ